MLKYTEEDNEEEDYTPIKITCPDCLGSKTGTKCLKHQREDTRYNTEQHLPELMEKAGIPKRFLNARIADFPKLIKKYHLKDCLIPSLDNIYKGKGRPPQLPVVHDRDFPSPPKGLLIEGPVGTGKTHLLCAIAAEVIMDGGKSMFIRSTQFLSDIKKTYTKPDLRRLDYRYPAGSDNVKIGDLEEKAKKIDYLFIDDLGVAKETEWAYAVWYDLIDFRCAECKYTSVSLNDADKFDSRIKRRLLELCEYVLLTK